MSSYFSWFGLPGSFVLTCLLSLLALLLAIFCGGTDRWLCFAAMILSSVGDVFLMDFRNLSEKFPNYFIIGASFFMVSHLVYAAAFIKLIRQNGYVFKGAGMNTAAVIAAMTLIFFFELMIRSRNLTVFNVILMVVYLGIISVNMACVFSFAFHAAADGQLWRLISAAGVFSFFISDGIIGLGMMGGVDGCGHLIWWFYPIGQILLLIGG